MKGQKTQKVCQERGKTRGPPAVAGRRNGPAEGTASKNAKEIECSGVHVITECGFIREVVAAATAIAGPPPPVTPRPRRPSEPRTR